MRCAMAVPRSSLARFGDGDMMVLTDYRGQPNLPRYFGAAFDTAKHIRTGRLDIVLDDGRRFRVEGAQPGQVAEIHVHNADLFARLIREGDLGFSEAYIEGWWSSPDLQAFLDLVSQDNDTLYTGYPGMGLVRAFERVRFWFRNNSKTQAQKNISHHYDLGNDFYRLWLDDTMTYSSAIFETGQESLETAQQLKYASMIDQIGVSEGDHVLEIGCGWGGFAEYAAKERGLRVTALTISREQHEYAQRRIQSEGLSDRVEIKLQDYRDEKGTYDGIASIEMFEAVGEQYWPVYFDTVKSCLTPGGAATLQIITIEDHRWEAYRKGVDFIQKFIFPGGMLPAPKVLRAQVERAGLEFSRSIEFAESYSQTLRRWHEVFNQRWDEISALGFDERFRRMWNMYLTSCASAFQTRICDVTQITVRRPI